MPRAVLLVTLGLLTLGVVAAASPLAAVLAGLALLVLLSALRRRQRGALRRSAGLMLVGTAVAALVAALAVPAYHGRPAPLLIPVDGSSLTTSASTTPAGRSRTGSTFDALGFVVTDDDGAAQAVDANVGQLSTLAATGLTLAAAPGSVQILSGSDAAQRAHASGAEALVVLSNYAGSGFDGARARRVLTSPAARRRLVSAVSAALAKGGDDGLVLDFEQLDGGLRQPLVDLVRQLHRTLGNHRLVVAVPARDDRSDPDLQAFDLPALAASADRLLLMAYDQHETTSGPGPVAGLDWVRRTLSVAGIAPGKLLLGIPSYGYVWPRQGPAREITVAQGRALTHLPGARVRFDPVAREREVLLPDGGQAWYDDAEAVRERVALARTLHAAGVGVWRLGAGDPLDSRQLGAVRHGLPGRVPGRLVERVRARGLVALTFDDGPDPQWTPRILAVLRQLDTPATFFDIGTQAQAHPDLVREEVRDGDVVGNHTFSHQNISTLPGWRARAEIQGGALVLEGVTGRRPRLFRSPYGAGELSDAGSTDKDQLAERLGFHAVNWTVDTLDWRRPGAASIVAAVDGQRAQRSIVLMHDGGGDRSQTLAALPAVIRSLRARGYQFTTVDALDGSISSPYFARSSWSSRARGLAIVAGFQLDMAIRRVVLLVLLILGAVALLRLVVGLPLALHHRRRMRRAPAAPFALPTVTALVPAHNEAAVLDRSIESLLALDPPPLEVLVVDDGSTDGTAQIAARYPVRVLSQPQAGKASALNHGIGQARGDVVLAMDADTILERDFLRAALPPFQDPQVGAVAGNVKVGNRGGLLARLQALEYIISLNIDRRAQAELGAITVVPGAAGVFRREALTAVGGYPRDTLVEDADLTLALLRAGWRIRYATDAVAYTEAPQSVRDVLRQRSRWSFGTVQVAAKHSRATLDPAAGRVGVLAVPWLMLSQIVVPALGPLVDVFLLYLVLVGDGLQALAMVGLALLLDLVVAAAAVWLDREDPRLLPWVPLLRLVWRPLQLWTAIGSVLRWLNGSSLHWGRLRRTRSVRIPVLAGLDG